MLKEGLRCLKGVRVCKGGLGASGVSAMRFGKNFKKTKVAGHP